MVAGPSEEAMGLFRNTMAAGSGLMGQGQGVMDASTGYMGSGASGVGTASNGLFGMASGDPTGQQIARASQYATNPFVNDAVNAATLDARRSLTEVDRPGIDRNAAATGNLNSSRTGVAEGIAERGLAERTAALSAGMRSDLFGRGLDMAQTDDNQALQAFMGAGGLSGDLLKNGLYGKTAGAEIVGTGVNIAGMGASAEQAGRQAGLDNSIAKDQYQLNRAWQPFQNWSNILQANNWGGTRETEGTTTTESDPSVMSTIGGWLNIFGQAGSLRNPFAPKTPA